MIDLDCKNEVLSLWELTWGGCRRRQNEVGMLGCE